MSVKLGEQSKRTSVMQEQSKQQHIILAIVVQYSTRHYKHWMFVYCMCLQSKQEISWSLLTRHTLFSDSYFYLVTGMKTITSLYKNITSLCSYWKKFK